MNAVLTKEVAQKVLDTVDAGLASGLGEYPKWVGGAVRDYGICVSNSKWPTNEDREKGMRRFSIAQLGSNQIDQSAFSKIVALHSMRRILPMIMRNAVKDGDKYGVEIEGAAQELENSADFESTVDETKKAELLMRKASADAYPSVTDYEKVARYARECAGVYAYTCAYPEAYATAYTIASNFAITFANADKYFRLEVLKLLAQIAVDALIELRSPGAQWLDLCGEE